MNLFQGITDLSKQLRELHENVKNSSKKGATNTLQLKNED